MKLYLSLLFVVVFAISSCKENQLVFPENVDKPVEDDGERVPVKPDYVEVVADYDGGRVEINWPEIDKERIKSIIIRYDKGEEEEVIEITDFSEPLILEDLEIGHHYEFMITAVGLKGEVSKVFTVDVTPKPFAYDVIAGNIEVVGGDKEIFVNWLNTTGRRIQVDVSVDGEEYSSGLSDQGSGSITIPISRGVYDVEMSISDTTNKSSQLVANNVRVIDEVLLSTDGWVATANSEYTAGENTGLASALIDGDVSTYWHTDWTGSGPPYPHWAQFDMLENHAVSKISMARRQGNGTGMTRFKLEGSLDGVNWNVILDNQAFNKDINDFQTYSFGSQECRYLRMTATDGPNKYTHLAEIQVYAYK